MIHDNPNNVPTLEDLSMFFGVGVKLYGENFFENENGIAMEIDFTYSSDSVHYEDNPNDGHPSFSWIESNDSIEIEKVCKIGLDGDPIRLELTDELESFLKSKIIEVIEE